MGRLLLTIQLSPVQRQIVRQFLAAAPIPPDIFHSTLRRLKAGQAVEVTFEDLGRIVDALGPQGDQLITCLRMAEAEALGVITVFPARDPAAEGPSPAPLGRL